MATESSTRPFKPKTKGLYPYFFLIPYILVTAVFFLFPFFNALTLAFYQTNGPHSRVFVGFENFRFLLSDRLFQAAIWNTTLYAIVSVFVQLPLALGLALLLNSGSKRIRSIFRLIFFSPNLVGQILVGMIFSVLLLPRYGLVNRASQAILHWGIETNWLGNPRFIMSAIILVSLWLWVGFNMVYFLAALQTVDKSLEEAARMDGANPWQVFWHVTLPSMRHVVMFVVVMSIIGSYQLFELPLSLLSESSGLGTDNAGLTLITYLNYIAFRTGDLGLGSAVGWIIALIIFTISIIQIRLTRMAED